MALKEPTTGNRRLESWKEIAAFFGRDERTVNRWEKDLHLPVHRLPGKQRGRVYAYTEELRAWAQRPRGQASAGDGAAGPGDPGELIEFPTRDVSPASEPANRPSHRFLDSRLALAAAVLAAVALALWFVSHRATAGARANSELISGSFTGRASNQTAAAHSPNLHAEELYLKGRFYWNRRTPESLNRALDNFTQAIVADPNYAKAYVGLADCYNLLREHSTMSDAEAYPRAMAAVSRAVELDDTSAEAHASLAFILFFWKWDVPGANHEFHRAIQLDPNYADAHHWYANALLYQGRSAEALAEIGRAQQLAPSSASILADKGLILNCNGQDQEAFSLLKQLESTNPDLVTPHHILMGIYLRKEDYPNYLAELTEAARLRPDSDMTTLLAAGKKGYEAAGKRGLLSGILEAQKKNYQSGLGSAYELAQTSTLLGDRPGAMRYLRTSYDKRETRILEMRMDQLLVPLHPDLEFARLLSQLGLQAVS
jgi:tetratricopeptide (TPR) repeat protein